LTAFHVRPGNAREPGQNYRLPIRPSTKQGRKGKEAMENKSLAVLVTIGFSCMGVLGDYFLKLASTSASPLKSRWFYVGFVVYASTAFGWVFVMRHLKLATIGVVYSVSMVFLLTAIGVVLFQESISYYEVAGLGLGIASLLLLVRFG
jgi:small multidrug resistance pump